MTCGVSADLFARLAREVTIVANLACQDAPMASSGVAVDCMAIETRAVLRRAIDMTVARIQIGRVSAQMAGRANRRGSLGINGRALAQRDRSLTRRVPQIDRAMASVTIDAQIRISEILGIDGCRMATRAVAAKVSGRFPVGESQAVVASLLQPPRAMAAQQDCVAAFQLLSGNVMRVALPRRADFIPMAEQALLAVNEFWRLRRGGG